MPFALITISNAGITLSHAAQYPVVPNNLIQLNIMIIKYQSLLYGMSIILNKYGNVASVAVKIGVLGNNPPSVCVLISISSISWKQQEMNSRERGICKFWTPNCEGIFMEMTSWRHSV